MLKRLPPRPPSSLVLLLLLDVLPLLLEVLPLLRIVAGLTLRLFSPSVRSPSPTLPSLALPLLLVTLTLPSAMVGPAGWSG